MLVTIACFVATPEIVCVLPSKVIDLSLSGAIEPILIPVIISPETKTPLSCKFPREEISLGILAEIFTLSICEVELFETEIIK